MAVKICPKCKTANRADAALCVKCYSSLESVQAQSQQPATAANGASAEADAQNQKTAIENPARPQTSYSAIKAATRKTQKNYDETKSTRTAINAILLVIMLAGSLLAITDKSHSVNIEKITPPEKVLQMFFEAKKKHSADDVLPYFTPESASMVKSGFSDSNAGYSFKKDENLEMLLWNVPPSCKELGQMKIKCERVVDPEISKNRAVVKVSMLTPGANQAPQEIHYIMKTEKREWKVDYAETLKENEKALIEQMMKEQFGK